MNAFVYNDSLDYLYLKDGKILFAPVQPEWKDGLAYLKRLYDEGLLDRASFTQDTAALKTLGSGGDVAQLGAVPAGTISHIVPYSENGRNGSYQAVPPLKGPDGVQLAMVDTNYGSTKSTSSFSISTQCEHPDAAMKLGDYLLSEDGTMRAEVGEEGVHWKAAEAGELDLNGEQAKWTQIPVTLAEGEVANYNWYQLAATFRSRSWRESWSVPQDQESQTGLEKKLFAATKNYEPYAPKEILPALFIDPSRIDDLSLIKTNLSRYVKESEIGFITGELSLETGWDSYVQQLNNMSLEQYLKDYQASYDTTK